MTSSQTALLVTEIGKPLVKGSRPVPVPRENEVLIQVTVAGLNPHDAKSRDHGLFIKNSLPAVLAADLAGRVVKVGSNVTRFKEGDDVFGQTSFSIGQTSSSTNRDTQGLQQFAILDVRATAKVPAGFSSSQVATLPTNLTTSAVALFDPAALDIPAPWDHNAAKTVDLKSQSILIVGGGTNTGKFAIQLAALVGFGNIIVVAGLKGEAAEKKLGATHVIDRTLPPSKIVANVREIVGDDLVYAYDTINSLELQAAIGVESLSNSKKGKFARLLPFGPIDETKLSSKKFAGFETLNVFGGALARPKTGIPLWQHISELLEEGKIEPLRYHVIKGLDVDAVNRTLDGYGNGSGTLDGYGNGSVTGQWQVHI